MNPFSPYQPVTTHDMMFNAVESARWMATTSGPYEDPNRHLQQQHHQYPTLLRPVATRPPPAPPPPIAAPLSTIAAITTEEMDRRASDTSVISETSSNAGSIGQGVSSSMSFGFPQVRLFSLVPILRVADVELTVLANRPRTEREMRKQDRMPWSNPSLRNFTTFCRDRVLTET